MAAGDCAGLVHFCALRVARLQSNGNFAAGPDNLYVTDAVGRLRFTPRVTAGTNLEAKNGCGAVALQYKGRDVISGWDLELSLLKPSGEPELVELLAGGDVLVATSGSTSVGYKAPSLGQIANEDGVSIEAWSRRINSDGSLADPAYFRTVFPRTYWNLGERTLEEAIQQGTLTGFAEENEAWYDGPAHDWYSLTDTDLDRAWATVEDDDIPSAVCGYQTIAAS